MNLKNTLLKYASSLSIGLVGVAIVMALCCGRTHLVQTIYGNTLFIILTVALVAVMFLGWLSNENQAKTSLSIVFSGLILAVFWIWQFIHLYKYYHRKDFLAGQLQDIQYDGFVELLFAGVGIILTFTAFYIQYIANRQHSKNFEEARLDNRRARFESTYFDALRSMKDLVASQNIDGVGNGLDVFRYMFWEYKAMVKLVEKVLGDDERNEIIAFYFFLNGVSVTPNSNSKLSNCLSSYIDKKNIDEIINWVNKTQTVNTIKEKDVNKAISEGLFSGIRDYMQSSLINKKRIMWFDGHRHRLLPYVRMRMYVNGILQTDEYINTSCNSNETISLRENRKKRYELYFKACYTEYEEELVRVFYIWLENLSDNDCIVLEINKDDYLLDKFV